MNNEKPDEGTQSEPIEINPGSPPTLRDPEPHNRSSLEHPDPTILVRMNEFWSYDPRTHTIGLTTMLEGIDHAKLEAQVSAAAQQVNASGWTVLIDYMATGEGRHVWYKRSHAATESEAIEDFRTQFFGDDTPEAWAFWSKGIEVYPGAFFPNYITGYRIPPNELKMYWQSQF
jgi:hypothetical protein